LKTGRAAPILNFARRIPESHQTPEGGSTVNGLQQVRRGLGRAWDNVLEGWQHLRENAAGTYSA